MLEAVLEQLLLRFLAPYLEGISKDKLHLGVFSGLLELRDLGVKADALALIGNPTLRVKKGRVGFLRLHVPWTHLHSGKLRVSIEHVHFEVERIGDESSHAAPPTDAELVQQLREAKQKAIALRAEQLKDLVKQREEEGSDDSEEGEEDDAATTPGTRQKKAKRQGLIAKLIRKIINNVQMDLTDMEASYSSPSFGLACGISMERLDVVSTDARFRAPEQAGGGEVVVPDGALYKLFRLRRLSCQMAPVGVSELTDAAYVLHPVSASLRLAHEPRQGLLRTEFEVAHEDILELTIVRSQVKHLRNAQAARGQEYARLFRLMVPESEEASLFKNAMFNLREYTSLYERQRLFEEELEGDGDEPLTKAEEKRLQVLEDALAIRLLAQGQAQVQQRLDTVRQELALREKSGSLVAERQSGTSGTFAALSRWWGGLGLARKPSDDAGAAFAGQNSPLGLTSADAQRLAQDLEDDSKFEGVDMPSRMRFEFRLGMCALDMIDDRWQREDQRQVLSLAMEQSRVSFCLTGGTDFHGRDSAEWRLEMILGAFHAFQAAHVAFRFCPGHNISPKPGARLSVHELEDGEAARLIIASELGSDENVMKLIFKFAPTEIHMPQGLIEEVRELIRVDLPPAPELPTEVTTDEDLTVEATSPVGRSGTLRSLSSFQRSVSELESRRGTLGAFASLRRSVSELDTMDNPTKVAEMVHGHLPAVIGSRSRAQTLAQKVYDRIPDKLELDVFIASPIFHVPIPGQGTTIFSLGLFHLRTPAPCEYSKLDIHFELDEMVLCAKTIRGERFDMFKPVLFKVEIQYKSHEDGSELIVKVDVEKAGMTLVPQSLQMFLATPFAMASVLWGKQEKQQEQPQEPVQPQQLSEEGSQGTEKQEAADEQVTTPSEPDEEQKSEDSVSVEEAAQAPARQFIISATIQFDALDLTLADSVVPVMVWHMRWTPPGLQIYRTRLPHPHMTVDIAFAVEVEILNPRNNAWEPFIEHFHGGIQMVRECPNDSRKTKLMVSAKEELLLNLKPTMLQRFLWFTPLFLTGLTFEEDLVVTSSDAATADVTKYRVVNLSSHTLEIEFKSCHRTNLVTQIAPTGSDWQHLDKWVVSPYFATGLVVRLPGMRSSERSSEQLSLEHDGAVVVPDSGLVAELLTPSPLDRMQHRMLLLGSALRVHNQTDLPLLVRYHSSEKEVLKFQVPLSKSTSCDGDLLGFFSQEFVDTELSRQYTQEALAVSSKHNALLLMPNAVAAVPVEALVREQGVDVGISYAWLSVCPALAGFAFCDVAKVGADSQTYTLHCRRDRASEGPKTEARLRHVHLICESRTERVSWPRPNTITTVVIQPALSLMNALPFGDLIVGYAPKVADQFAEESLQEARVPHLKQLNVYNFPGNLLKDGISVRLRFSGGHWSSFYHFGHGSLKDRGACQPIELRQRRDGAAAGLVIEHTDGFRLRFSCPACFVDRSGLDPSVGLRLTHRGLPLPHEDGITLLPEKWLEQDCQLVVASGALTDCSKLLYASGFDFCSCSSSSVRLDRTTSTMQYTIRMPPNFSLLNLPSTRAGPGVFCLQADDVSRKDMLGAECQVLTLRPRLILTNVSVYEVEVSRRGGGSTFSLQPGASKELHWKVTPGEEDAPTTTLFFRPVCHPPCQWSDEVICSDAAAGTKAFYLLPKPGCRSDASLQANGVRALGEGVPQVWSAEVAPTRGALAVSFRDGSAFAAVNRSSRVTLIIQPLDEGKVLADVIVPPHGDEVPFGWLKPFKPTHVYAVNAVINGKKVMIPDIRRTKRWVVHGVIVGIARVGAQTLVSIEDGEAAEEGAAAKVIESTFTFDLRLSKLGISCIEEVPLPRELLYVHLDLIRLEWHKDSEKDTKRIKFVISDVQVDCQLPGRFDASRSGGSDAAQPSNATAKLPAVILANCDYGDRMFLKLLIEQGATSSADIMIPRAEISFDRLDFSVDDGWVEPLVSFARQCRSGSDNGLSLASVRRTAGQSAVLDYSPPPLPSVVQVERLTVDAIKLTLWCSLKLRSCGFLPAYVRDALRVLSFSDELTLEDATLSLPERVVPLHRGSLRDFLRGLASEYTVSLVSSTGVVLGKSSLLNLPRVPLRLGGTTVSFFSDTVGLVAGEAASLMNHLTFDDEYVTRQRQIRSRKQIHGLADGMHEAGRSLGQGLEGVLDVVKKPAEGWRAGGFQGAVLGIGQGVASGFVKPLSNLGQAISDVGAGISAAVGPESANAQRQNARRRKRLPRLLFSDGGAIRPWSEIEAELLWQLGPERMRGIQEVLCVHRDDHRHWVLLLYTYRLELVEINVEGTFADNHGDADGGNNGTAPARGADLLDAIDESTEKIFWQAMKPVTKLVTSLRDLNKGSASRHSSDNAQCFWFSELRQVRRLDVDGSPVIELQATNSLIPLQLNGVNKFLMSPLVQDGLEHGFRSAIDHAESAANWGILHTALREEHLRSQEAASPAYPPSSLADIGELTLEVFEVERWMVMANEWQTPSLPTDSHLKWRWVDATGQKHPHLQRQATRQRIAAAKTPPIELDAMFETAGEWTIEKGDWTDSDGWMYGISWRSSTWDSKASLFDVLRRRKWTRTFR